MVNTLNCFIKLRRDLIKTGQEDNMIKLLQYKYDGSEQVFKNTTFTTSATYLGYGTEDKD